jgi:DNA-binding FadR family transcriptional regulator
MKTEANNVQKIRLSDQLIYQILKQISKGKLKIGDKMPPERVLVERYGVGRSTVREAMHTLSVMGVIAVSAGKGAVVINVPDRPLDLPLKWNSLKRYPKAEELVAVRILLEQGIIESLVKNAQNEDIKNLEKIIARMESAQNDRNRFLEADLAFHVGLAEHCHNQLLAHFFNEIRTSIASWLKREAPYTNDEGIMTSLQRHKLILQAIKDKNASKAKVLIRKHIEKD